MPRRFLNLIMLIVLGLQGLGVHAAMPENAKRAAPEATTPHCAQMAEQGASHAATSEAESFAPDHLSGDCCDSTCATMANCAPHCAIWAVSGADRFLAFAPTLHSVAGFTHRSMSDPNYIPLNPPPIA